MKWLLLLCLFLSACGSDENAPGHADEDSIVVDGDIEQGDDEGEIAEAEVETDIDREDGDLDFLEMEEETAETDFVEQEEEAIPATACNGFDELCPKRFDEVAYATTHNAMSNEDDGWIAPNQIHNMERQLEDGIRAMMLDVYEVDDTLWLCHGDCMFGKIELSEAFGQIKRFLDANPREVLTLIFESYISADNTVQAIEQAGLTEYLHSQSTEEPWPSLQEMIDSGRRLVILADEGNNDPSWYHHLWDHCWDTPWHVQQPEDFICHPGRGSTDNALWILNHMLYSSVDLPSKSLAEQANSNPFFMERVSGCREEMGRIPNFITVDHYSLGDTFEVVNSLNAVAK